MIHIESVYFEKNDLTCEFDNNLAYYGIYEKSIIRFNVNYIGGNYIIKCHHPAFTKNLELENYYTIEEVKKKIFESVEGLSSIFSSFSPRLLTLEYYGKILEDNRTISDYGIHRERTIDLYIKFL